MSPDPAAAARQPSDETPLDLGDGMPAGPTPQPAAADPDVPRLPEVDAGMRDVAAVLVPAIDRVDGVVTGVIGDVKAELVKHRKAAEKQLKGVLMDVDQQLSTAHQSLAAEGVPVSYLAAERAAELDDPTGAAILSRVEQFAGAQGADAAPVGSPPPGILPGAPTTYPAPPVPPVPPPVPDFDWHTPGGPPPGDPPPNPDPLPPPGAPDDAPGPPPPDPDDPFGEQVAENPDCPPWSVRHVWDSPTADRWEVYPGPVRDARPILDGKNWLVFEVIKRDGAGYVAIRLDFYPDTVPPGAVWVADPAGFGSPVTPAAVVLTCLPDVPRPPAPPPGPEAGNGPIGESQPGFCISGPGLPASGLCTPTDPRAAQCCPPQEITVQVPPPPAAPRENVPVGVGPRPEGTERIDWDSPRACAQASKIGDVEAPRPAPHPGRDFWRNWVTQGAGEAGRWEMTVPGIGALASQALGAITSLPAAVGQTVANQVIGGALSDSLAALPSAQRMQSPRTSMTIMASLALAGVAEEHTHAPWSYVFTQDRYTLQYLNPQYIPSQSEVDNAYLTNQIDGGYWDCLTRANGNLPGPARLVLQSKQVRPGIGEVVSLTRRGVIQLDADYPRRLRELGVTDPGHAAEYWRLSEYVPPYTDVMRMMVRDSADQAVVDRYGYDLGFERKFAGPLKKWAADQGIGEEAARYLWRAHWDTPSNTALYEMLHRLRPDRPAFTEWAAGFKAAADPVAYENANPRPEVVTEADARYMLEVNDMAPNWVGPLISISYRPITNTDARRMYEIGSIDENELFHRIRDNGYSPEDAKGLVKYESALRSRRIGNLTGSMSPRKVLTAFREGLVDELETDRLLVPYFPDPDVRRVTIQRARDERLIETRRVQVRSFIKSYVFGEIDSRDLETLLARGGIVGAEALSILARARARRDDHKKELRIQYLLDALSRGLLTPDQAADRMDRLGYSPEDTARMIQLTGSVMAERQATRAAAAANRARLEAQRARREAIANLEKLERELKERIAARERYLAQLGQEIQAAGGQVP